GEYARADFDRLHRLGLLGRVAPRKIADIGVSLTLNSAGPYTELLGVDLYNNARGRARPPGVARTTLDAAGRPSLDPRPARDIALGPRKSERELTIGADVSTSPTGSTTARTSARSDRRCSRRRRRRVPPGRCSFSARFKF